MQPVAEVVNMCMNAGTPVHIDAAAAFGHVPVRFDELGADYVSVSSHKLGGPPGVGALVVRRGLRLAPLIVGGSEERARRAGAENVLGIVGFGAACAALAELGVLEAEAATATAQTSALLAAACGVSGVEVVGDPTDRVPHITCVAVGGVKGEAVLLSLDRAGIAVHSGSACSSEILEPSPVLEAIGADPEQSLRMSVGWSTTAADVAAFAKVFPGVVTDLRALARR
jgi:cysteine desulfurase